MMILRKNTDRGHFNHGWLDTWHSFSFADYHDPQHVSFSHLRVINDDIVAPGVGFPTHPHRNMEIVTYILEGALQHRDSMGNGSIIRAGEVQRMSAGRGITHSECNASPEHPVRLLQIWIMPRENGIEPGYEQQAIPDYDRRGVMRLVASPDNEGGAVHIHQDARLYSAHVDAGHPAQLALPAGRRAYVHVARGALRCNSQPLEDGDGLKITDISHLTFDSDTSGEVLVFDLP